jgi:hypothetical protein
MTVDGGDRVATFERGEALEVPLAKIENELAALWRQAAARSASGPKRQPVTRACLWNLVLRVEGEDRFRATKRLIDELSDQVPARVILCRAEPTFADGPMRAWVEANWRRPEGGQSSGSDEVTLLAPGGAVSRLPSMVRALLSVDAPTAVLWLEGNELESGRTGDVLLGEVDRLILDSRQFADERTLVDLGRLAAAHPRLELVDLSWLGVRPLRGLCASLFDPPHDPRPLEALDRVRVTSGVAGTQSRSLLTLGWLSARLGWRNLRREAGASGLRRWRGVRRGGGEIVIELGTRTSGASHGVVGLELEAGGAVWTLERDRSCIDVNAPGLPRRLQPVRSHSDVELVVSALGVRGRDPVYREALGQAALLVGAA